MPTKMVPNRMKQFYVVGDILHPGRVIVEAKSRDVLLTLLRPEDSREVLSEEEFTIQDEESDCLGFLWNGDEDSIEEVEKS